MRANRRVPEASEGTRGKRSNVPGTDLARAAATLRRPPLPPPPREASCRERNEPPHPRERLPPPCGSSPAFPPIVSQAIEQARSSRRFVHDPYVPSARGRDQEVLPGVEAPGADVPALRLAHYRGHGAGEPATNLPGHPERDLAARNRQGTCPSLLRWNVAKQVPRRAPALRRCRSSGRLSPARDDGDFIAPREDSSGGSYREDSLCVLSCPPCPPW